MKEIREVEITNDMREEAQRQADELPALNHSIRQGEGNIYGFLGELIFVKHKGGQQKNTYDYDIVMASGKTCDVKTKCVTSIPRIEYECSISAGHTKQKCDFYAFVRVTKDLKRGWYCGAISKADFFEKARFVKAGEPDGSNKWIPTVDCYNVTIADLTH